jgi:uncharacterized protein
MDDAPTFAARDEPGRVVLSIHVTPRARRDALAVAVNGSLHAWLRAAPVNGAANAALVALLADRLSLPRRAIVILRGETARLKQIAIVGQTSETLRQRLRLDLA